MLVALLVAGAVTNGTLIIARSGRGDTTRSRTWLRIVARLAGWATIAVLTVLWFRWKPTFGSALFGARSGLEGTIGPLMLTAAGAALVAIQAMDMRRWGRPPADLAWWARVEPFNMLLYGLVTLLLGIGTLLI